MAILAIIGAFAFYKLKTRHQYERRPPFSTENVLDGAQAHYFEGHGNNAGEKTDASGDQWEQNKSYETTQVEPPTQMIRYPDEVLSGNTAGNY